MQRLFAEKKRSLPALHSEPDWEEKQKNQKKLKKRNWYCKQTNPGLELTEASIYVNPPSGYDIYKTVKSKLKTPIFISKTRRCCMNHWWERNRLLFFCCLCVWRRGKSVRCDFEKKRKKQSVCVVVLMEASMDGVKDDKSYIGKPITGKKTKTKKKKKKKKKSQKKQKSTAISSFCDMHFPRAINKKLRKKKFFEKVFCFLFIFFFFFFFCFVTLFSCG